uniref:30S ribosomal protein S1, chloroplastic n=1 Tax=Anthurium amnicola TaxID=1678845 RepID=A0A1D1YZI5_9ARAE
MQTRPCSHLRPVPFSTLCYPSHSRRSRTLRIPRTHTSFLSKVHTFPFPATEFPLPRRTHARLPSPDGGFPESHVKEAELELLGKPSPTPVPSEEEEEVSVAPKPVEMEAALAPFLKFSRARDASEEARVEGEAVAVREPSDGEEKRERELLEKVAVEYYEPRPGDFVVGVVVSGNEQKLDVNVGAAMLGTMLTKEVLPLYGGELAHALCDLGENAEEFMVPGKIGIAKDEEALSWEPAPGRPVVEVGSVLFAEVFGRSLSGRPLLSTRRMFRRVAWHRARQIKQLNKPIKVRITEWNTGGLLTRIEGLRAFLPKAELMNRVNSFTELKKNVGCHIFVCISRIDEDNNDLIISEREAWDILHLQEGTLLEGTVRKIFPFGAQVRIGETNRSIADLESEPGLFLSNKEKVLAEAEQMAKRYKLKLSSIPAHAHAHAHSRIKSLMIDALPFDDEAILYSNWKWFNFEHDEQDT